MKKKLLFLLTSIVLLFSLTSCTTFKASGLSATVKTADYDVVGYMDETIHFNKFLGTSGGSNLANITGDATESEINSEIADQIFMHGGDAIINMNIDYGASFLNLLGNAITYGIWAPSKAHVTGTIVKYKDSVTM